MVCVCVCVCVCFVCVCVCVCVCVFWGGGGGNVNQHVWWKDLRHGSDENSCRLQTKQSSFFLVTMRLLKLWYSFFYCFWMGIYGVAAFVPYVDFEAIEQLTQSDLSLLFPVDEITGKTLLLQLFT